MGLRLPIVLTVLFLAAAPARGAPESALWERWVAQDPASAVSVEGEALSLDDIEHRILRPIWKDPRLHYVLNCAALGCPNLQPRAFTAGNAQALLSRGARRYVNDPRGVAFDGDRLIVSSLYDWYAADFGGTDTAIISHLKRYAGPVLLAKLEAARCIDDDYDWALNDAP